MELTLKEQQTLAAKASFIKERLQGKTTNKKEHQANTHLYQQWQRKAGGRIGLSNFNKRLFLDEITEDEAKWVLTDAYWNQKFDLPDWLETIRKVVLLFPVSKKELENILIFNATNQSINVPKQMTYYNELYNDTYLKDMLDSIFPFLYVAEQKLINILNISKIQFTKEALANLSHMLAIRICFLSCNIFDQELKNYIEEKQPFFFLSEFKELRKFIPEFTDLMLAGAWKDIFIKYPVFARLLSITIDNWINFIVELSALLDKDNEKLMEAFNRKEPLGKIIEVKGNPSASQDKGKTVLILKFEAGVQIVYKPKDLSIDLAFTQFINWLNKRDFPYAIKTPKTLNYHTYGWCEYIERIPLDDKKEVSEFYRRAGVLLGLLYAFSGYDFHSGNLIAGGNHPVLIDIETLMKFKVASFHQETNTEAINVYEKAAKLINSSVMKIGFLPSFYIRSNNEIYDYGALTNNQQNNMPLFKDGPPNIKDYQQELLEGFAAIYNFFLENKAEIKNILPVYFGNCQLRSLLRGNKIYKEMQIHTTKTCFLDDGAKYSIEIERFAPAFLNNVPLEKAKRVWKIFLAERDHLEELDLPIFYGYTNKCGLWDKDKLLCDQYFEKSALDRLNESVDQMTLEDRELQMDFIRGSLNIYRRDVHNARENYYDQKQITVDDQGEIDEKQLMKEAESIYDQILARAIKDHQNMTWIIYHNDLNNNLIRIKPIDYSLYDGLFGISLFMSSLYQLSPKESFKNNALHLVEATSKALSEAAFSLQHFPLTYGRGLAGILNALFLISDYLKEEPLINYASTIINKIERTSIQKETNADVLNGLSGLVLILVKYYQRFKHEYALELATLGANELLKNKAKLKGIPSSGYLNGISGILYTQLKVYSVTGNEQFYDAAIEMLNDENEYLDSITNKGVCSGLAGIGLSRLGALKMVNDNKLNDSLEKIINLLLTYPMENSDHLCCGNTGRINFLIEASETLHRPELLKEARKMLCWLIQRKKQNSHYLITGGNSNFVFNPSFFQGLSGIGYEILRSINPNKVQNIFL